MYTSLSLCACARLLQSLRGTTSSAAAAADAAEDNGEDGDEKAEEKCTYGHPGYLPDGEVAGDCSRAVRSAALKRWLHKGAVECLCSIVVLKPSASQIGKDGFFCRRINPKLPGCGHASGEEPPEIDACDPSRKEVHLPTHWTGVGNALCVNCGCYEVSTLIGGGITESEV